MSITGDTDRRNAAIMEAQGRSPATEERQNDFFSGKTNDITRPETEKTWEKPGKTDKDNYKTLPKRLRQMLSSHPFTKDVSGKK